MRRPLVLGLIASLALVPTIAAAENAPQKSERAMSPESAKDGHSPGPKSERAMDPAAKEPGTSPNPKSERAMDPAKSEK